MSTAAVITCPQWCLSDPCKGEHFREVRRVKASGADLALRIHDPEDFPEVVVTLGFCEHPSEVPDDEPYITVGVLDETTERDLPLRAGEVRNLITALQTALGILEEPTVEERIEEARKVVAHLLCKHGITDQKQAKRLIRERFTEDDLHQWKRALRALDGNGAID